MSLSKVRFEDLIERHHDEIYRYLWRLLNNAGRSDRDMEAQDLTQEVFLRAYRAFERLQRDSNYRAWLYKIATNCGFSTLKRGRHNDHESGSLGEAIEQIPAGPGQAPEYQVALSEMMAKVRQSIKALPPKQQAAIVMRYGQGLSYAEISQALECSKDSARANVYQGLKRLGRELEDEVSDGNWGRI